jgi:hypothetical protein
MARFELITATFTDTDGVDREHEVILDRSTIQNLDTPFGRIKERYGFIRATGKRCIGFFGANAVFADDSNPVHYYSVHEFDGLWQHCRRDGGDWSAVTSDSGTGKLFAELEAFCESQGVVAQY